MKHVITGSDLKSLREKLGLKQAYVADYPKFSSWKCTQTQEKSAVARANLQHVVILPAKISNAATALFNQFEYT